VIFTGSNFLSFLSRKIPRFIFKKKRIHDFSFVPMKGFLPWSFKNDRILIYSMWFLFTKISLSFYLFKTPSGGIKLQAEGKRKGKVFFTRIFKEDIVRRNYSVNIIIMKSLTQITLLKGKNTESFQLHLDPDFDLGLIYDPNLEFNNNAIIKILYK
jgi:hypothetical protein